MSIIHEALKKVQASLEPKPPSLAVPPAAPVPNAPKGGNKIIFILLPVVAVALLAGYLYLRPSGTPPAPTAVHAPKPAQPVPAPQQNTPPAPAVASPPSPVPNTTPEPLQLNVQGVMADPKGNVVLINNKVYGEGDDLDGNKIVKITMDAIVVSKDGTEETIAIKR